MSKKSLLKLLDKIIDVPLLFLLPESKPKEIIPERIKRILIIRPGGLGDALLLLPLIKALDSRLPQVEIHLLCERRNSALAEFTDKIKRVYLYDKGLEILRCLRNKYDLVIDTEQWYTLSAITAFFIRAEIRIGFDTNKRGKLFTHPIPYNLDEYEIYSFLHLIEAFQKDLPIFDNNMPFINIPDDLPEALAEISPEKKDKIITIFPSATSKEKLWEAEKFGKVVQHLAKHGYSIVLVGSKKEKSLSRQIKAYEKTCIDLTGKTSIQTLSLILKASRLFLSCDSGLMHLAYAIGTPTLSLFGPTSAKKWAPLGNRNIAIAKEMECSPCSRFGNIKRCKRKIKCMSLISAEEVIERMEGALKVGTGFL